MDRDIAVSVIVVTKNEERILARCLKALSRFDEVVVVDSNSTDATKAVAASFGVACVDFVWNGRYPKKRQWCLETLSLRHDRLFFVDADEEVTSALADEIAALDWRCAGYFVRGAYVVDGMPTRFGLKNNKLCLFDRRAFSFPVVDDLHVDGMGEIEGHYQPVPVNGAAIGQIKTPLLHHAMEDKNRWAARHEGYAMWERGVRGLPRDLTAWRQIQKAVFSVLPFRAAAAFLHSYVILLGFLDGARGVALAASRYRYYSLLGG